MTLVIETNTCIHCPLCDYRSAVPASDVVEIQRQIMNGTYKCPACDDGRGKSWTSHIGPYGTGVSPYE